MAGRTKLFGSRRDKGRIKSDQFKINEELFVRKDPMRVPYSAVRFNRKIRRNGRKPKYKNVRRGLGRPTVDIMLF